MAVIAPRSSSRDERIIKSLRACPSGSDDADWVAIEESGDVLDDLRIGTPVILLRDVADMRRQKDVGRAAQWMIYRQRLAIVDVEGRVAEVPCRKRFDNRTGVDDWSSRRVDEDRGPLHQRDVIPANQTAAARAQHEVHGENVRLPQQRLFVDPLDANGRRVFGCQVLTPGDHLHIEGKADPSDGAAEPAEPEDAQRLAFDAVTDPGLPHTIAHRAVVFGDPPGGAQDEAPSELGGIQPAAFG